VMQPRVFPDLIIEERIPSCETCPSSWKNEQIAHKIICDCKCHRDGIERTKIEGLDPKSQSTKPTGNDGRMFDGNFRTEKLKSKMVGFCKKPNQPRCSVVSIPGPVKRKHGT
jgi:hypothetical protein